jgi:hypothetical protein
MRKTRKNWVVVRFVNNGRVKFWRDYGHIAWSSPVYEVLGYFHGTYVEGQRSARAMGKMTQETD